MIIHSIIDSLLGAMRKKDIGTFFPDNKKKFKNIRSPKMLKPIVETLNKNSFYINNLDINLVCEEPKVSKYREKIILSLSNLLNIDKELINLKGKTVEKLGLIGKEKASLRSHMFNIRMKKINLLISTFLVTDIFHLYQNYNFICYYCIYLYCLRNFRLYRS